MPEIVILRVIVGESKVVVGETRVVVGVTRVYVGVTEVIVGESWLIIGKVELGMGGIGKYSRTTEARRHSKYKFDNSTICKLIHKYRRTRRTASGLIHGSGLVRVNGDFCW